MHDVLTHYGYAPWVDRKIKSGTPWAPEILDRLASADAVIILWSKRSVASEWVRYEAAYAMGRSIYIGCSIEKECEIPEPYGRLQWARLVGWDGTATPEFTENVLDRLRAISDTGIEAKELDPKNPWPEYVPRQLFWSAKKWILTNSASILASIATLVILSFVLNIVYSALTHQLVKVQEATGAIETESAKMASALSALNRQLNNVENEASAVGRNISELQKKLASLAAQAEKTAAASELELFYNEPVLHLNIVGIFLVHATPENLSTQQLVVGHADAIQFYLSFESRKDMKDEFIPTFLAVGSADKVPIPKRRLQPNVSFDYSVNELKEDGPISKIARHLDFEHFEPARYKAIAFSFYQTDLRQLTENKWPVRTIRDLNHVTIECADPEPSARCEAILLQVNNEYWIGKKLRNSSDDLHVGSITEDKKWYTPPGNR
jgi:hypothetical protein